MADLIGLIVSKTGMDRGVIVNIIELLDQ